MFDELIAKHQLAMGSAAAIALPILGKVSLRPLLRGEYAALSAHASTETRLREGGAKELTAVWLYLLLYHNLEPTPDAGALADFLSGWPDLGVGLSARVLSMTNDSLAKDKRK